MTMPYDQAGALVTTQPQIIQQKKTPAQCKYLGNPMGFVKCSDCAGEPQIKTFECLLPLVSGHDLCTISKKIKGYSCCRAETPDQCPGYLAKVSAPQP